MLSYASRRLWFTSVHVFFFLKYRLQAVHTSDWVTNLKVFKRMNRPFAGAS